MNHPYDPVERYRDSLLVARSVLNDSIDKARDAGLPVEPVADVKQHLNELVKAANAILYPA